MEGMVLKGGPEWGGKGRQKQGGDRAREKNRMVGPHP